MIAIATKWVTGINFDFGKEIGASTQGELAHCRYHWCLLPSLYFFSISISINVPILFNINQVIIPNY